MRKLRPSYKYSKLSNQDLNLDSLEPEPMLLWQGRDIGSAVIYSWEILISQIYTGKYDSYSFCLHGAHNWAVLLSQQGSLCKDKTWLPNNTRWSHISVPKEQSYSHFQLFTSLLIMLLTSLTVSPVSLFQHMVRAPVQAMVNFLPPQTSSRQNPSHLQSCFHKSRWSTCPCNNSVFLRNFTSQKDCDPLPHELNIRTKIMIIS